MRLPGFAAVLVLGSACAPTTPDQVVLQFHLALHDEDGDRALALLDAPTRAELARLAREASRASGGAIPADPARMIERGDPSRYGVRPDARGTARLVNASARTLDDDGGRARVQLTLGGETSVVDLVREGAAWKIHLPMGTGR